VASGDDVIAVTAAERQTYLTGRKVAGVDHIVAGAARYRELVVAVGVGDRDRRGKPAHRHPAIALSDRDVVVAGGGREELAEQRLGQIVVDNLKAAVAKRTLRQFIAEPAATLRTEAVGTAAPNLRELGIALDAVQLQRVQLPDELSAAVYQRMQEGFDVLAAQRRAEGEAEAARIRAAADKQQAQILADGERNAQRIRGEGEAQASLISGRAFARSPQFAAFYRSMQAYRAAMGRPGDLLVIAPDGEFFKYLHSNAQH